jgi:hypothetical protein
MVRDILFSRHSSIELKHIIRIRQFLNNIIYFIKYEIVVKRNDEVWYNYQFESLSKCSVFQTLYNILTFFCHGWTAIVCVDFLVEVAR